MKTPPRGGPAARMGFESPNIHEGEEQKASVHAPLRPRIIHEIIREEGEAELARPAAALAWSGLASGLSMSLSFLTQAILMSGLPDEPWRHLVASFGYCAGFIIVVLARQQLFTESTLTATLPVLTRRDAVTLRAMLRMWAIVLAANLLGTVLAALLMSVDGILPHEVRPALQTLALATMADPFGATLLQSVVAGWLIATMVWMLPSAGSARLLVILLLTYLVALGEFSHVIAGSVEAAYAVIIGEAGIGDYLVRFLAPTLLGNVVGGVLLVAFLNHAPLRHELVNPREVEAAEGGPQT